MKSIRKIAIADKKSVKELIMPMLGNENAEVIAESVVDDFYNDPCYSGFVFEEFCEIQGLGLFKSNSFEGANGVEEIVWFTVNEKYKQKASVNS